MTRLTPVLLTVALLGAYPPRPGVAPSFYVPSALAGSYADSGDCYDCVFCDQNEMMTETVSAMVDWGLVQVQACSWFRYCVDSTLCNGFDEEDLAALWDTATGGSIEALRSAIARFPDHIAFNADRGAVQIIGCRGDIVGNVPLGAELAGLLAQ